MASVQVSNAKGETMDEIIQFLTQRQFLANEVWRWACLLAAILVGLVAGRIVRFILEGWGRRLEAREDKKFGALLVRCASRPAAMFCFVVGLRIGLTVLTLNAKVAGVADTTLDVLYAVVVGYAFYRLVDILDHYLAAWAARTENKLDDMLVPLVRKSVRITVVIIVVIFVLTTVVEAKQVAAMLAGLGVGGLAVALAAQDTIKNFFGSVMILIDKPFQLGDRIIMGGHDGPVEEVGFRTTKIRTLDGHLVTVPNSTIVNEMVQNIGQRPYIKRVASITITYDTPPEKVRRAVEILKEILDNHEGMDPEFPPRVYFSDFNNCSLGILVIYWYHPPEYWDYMAFSEKVNMQILERFNAEGIEFAFPTQTVYLANDEKRQLAMRLLNEGPRAQIG